MKIRKDFGIGNNKITSRMLTNELHIKEWIRKTFIWYLWGVTTALSPSGIRYSIKNS